MKKFEKICISILKTQAKQKPSIYQTKILAAVEQCKQMKYKISPYELFWLTENGVKL